MPTTGFRTSTKPEPLFRGGIMIYIAHHKILAALVRALVLLAGRQTLAHRMPYSPG